MKRPQITPTQSDIIEIFVQSYDFRTTVITEDKVKSIRWFGHGHRMEENRIPKRALCMNCGIRLRGRPRNRWKNGVREDGKLGGGMMAGKST